MSDKEKQNIDDEQFDGPENDETIADGHSCSKGEGCCSNDDSDSGESKEDLLSRLQRVSADYVNYQKRMERERIESRNFVIADVITAFAEVLDDLELAINHARENHSDDDPLLVGTDMVYKKALEVFKRFGVNQIESVGNVFDPSQHEALQMQPTADAEPMSILYEVRKGYTLNDRTIRPARVIVATAVEEASDGE